ncbi:MAG: two-partner secretion domain-containing protein, partial [Nitrospira sp.]
GEFGVPTNHVANFLNDSGLATSNILGRVTGGNPSTIFGTIQTTGFGSANLFLMNPAGIVFGPNASLNVGGSVSFTTADYLRLADGAKFNAVPGSQDASISSAPVAAFGFLGSNPAAITVQGSQLAVSEGQGLSLVGGNIEITAGRLENGTSVPSRITAAGGHINVVSVVGAGEQSLGGTPAGLAGTSFDPANVAGQGGTIQLTSGAALETSSSTGRAGPILIRGGQLVMENAALAANTSSNTTDAVPSTAQGNISVQAEHVSLSNGSTLTASTSGADNAGNITIEARTLASNMGDDGLPLSGAAPVTIASNSTGQGAAGTIFVRGPGGQAAETVALSNTKIVANASDATLPTPNSVGSELVERAHRPDFTPMRLSADIEITAEKVALVNGTVIQADTTGGADAGSITLNVGTLKTAAGPDGRVMVTSTSHCQGCPGGQPGDIIIQGIPEVTPTALRRYVWVGRSRGEAGDVFEYYLAESLDLHGTDIHANAFGNAPGAIVMMRTQGQAAFTDTTVSVTTQDFTIHGDKPNGEFARNSGFSRIDIIAQDIALKDSTIAADAKVSDIGSCFLCQGGPSAGEIWLRAQNSVTADNSSITNTSSGRAQAGITKIIKDNFFSFGAVWEPDFPDQPTNTIRLTNSEVTVESQHDGLPGILRIRADNLVLDHSVLNSQVNNVSNVKDSNGQLIDVVGAGERSRALTDGRGVQGSLLVSAKNLDITGGGIIAPTHGNRIGSSIEIHADHLTTRPGTGPGGTLGEPRILNSTDPGRVVISSSSTGSGGAGAISITGESVPMPEGTPFPPASSIDLAGTSIETDTRVDALGGKIELKASGPIRLENTTISSNVNNVRPQSANMQDQGGNIDVSAGALIMHGSGISTVSSGTQNGGNIVVSGQESITLGPGSTISASNTGGADAGNLSINAGSQFLSQNASVTAQALHGSGGNITVQATDAIRLANSQINTSVQGGPNTSGGNILLDPAVVTLQNSQVLAQATEGAGGNISIIAGTFLADPTSVVSASSQFGLSGSVNIQSPISSLSNTLTTLPQRPLQAQQLLRQRCAAQTNGQLSSLVVAGRDALPVEPGGWLMSPLASMADDEPTPQAHLTTSRSFEPSRYNLGSLGQLPDQHDSSSQRGVWDRETGCGS